MRTIVLSILAAPLLAAAAAPAPAGVAGPPLGVLRLHLDRGVRPSASLPWADAPWIAEVRSAAREPASVTAARGGTVHGRVLVTGWAPTDAEQVAALPEGAEREPRPAPGLAVVLAKGAERHTVWTDADGRFDLEGLAPGTWTATVPDEDIPAFYQVTREVTPVAVGPGEESAVAIGIEPFVHFVRFVGDTPARGAPEVVAAADGAAR